MLPQAVGRPQSLAPPDESVLFQENGRDKKTRRTLVSQRLEKRSPAIHQVLHFAWNSTAKNKIEQKLVTEQKLVRQKLVTPTFWVVRGET